MTKNKVLHLLSQRPSLTGSGITLDSFVRHASSAGWDQRVVIGVPADDPLPPVADLDVAHILPLIFDKGPLDFPLPGMSDVMPYRSSRFSSLSADQLARYRESWKSHVAEAIKIFEPDLIHSHHVWILSALVKEIAPTVPVVTQCHATGLRQMALCGHLADEVRTGCARNDRFLVLRNDHAEELARALGIARERIDVIGAGYREDIFHMRRRQVSPAPRLLYVGKYSAAKGLPWLLDAVERLAQGRGDLELHVAGSGAGPEAERLRERMDAMGPQVVVHGQLSQAELAGLARRCTVCVLPSFYEGVPLVLVEAFACGCRLVATGLPGVREQIAPHLGPLIELVDPPRLVGVDTPHADDLPAFVDHLVDAIDATLEKPPIDHATAQTESVLEPFRWAAVFERVESVWKELIAP